MFIEISSLVLEPARKFGSGILFFRPVCKIYISAFMAFKRSFLGLRKGAINILRSDFESA